MSHRGENQDQEPEHTRFYRLDRSWSFDGEDHVISVAAYKLHINCTADATLGGHPGFVPDEYLNSLGPSTTLAAMDLVTSGYWERVDGGHRIRDWDLTRVAMESAAPGTLFDRQRCHDPGLGLWYSSPCRVPGPLDHPVTVPGPAGHRSPGHQRSLFLLLFASSHRL